MRYVFAKAKGGVLVPADPAAEKFVAGVRIGEGVTVEARKSRNVKFHRKLFSLLHLAFDLWEVPADRLHAGEPVRKDFEKFREDITILAGHYDSVFGVDGSVRLVARSISFANCDEHQFQEVYRGVLDVVWDKVFRQAHFRDKDEVERVVMELMSYGA